MPDEVLEIDGRHITFRQACQENKWLGEAVGPLPEKEEINKPMKGCLLVLFVAAVAVLCIFAWFGDKTEKTSPYISSNDYAWGVDEGIFFCDIWVRNKSSKVLPGVRLVSKSPGWEWKLPKDESTLLRLKPGETYREGWFPKPTGGKECHAELIRVDK